MTPQITLTSASNRWNVPASSVKNAKMEVSALPRRVIYSKAQGKTPFIDKARLTVAQRNTPKCPMWTGKIRRRRACSAHQVCMVGRPRTLSTEWAVLANRCLHSSSSVVNILKWATSRIQATLTRVFHKVRYSSRSLETTSYRPRWTLSQLHLMMVDSNTLAANLNRIWANNSDPQIIWALMDLKCELQIRISVNRGKVWL